MPLMVRVNGSWKSASRTSAHVEAVGNVVAEATPVEDMTNTLSSDGPEVMGGLTKSWFVIARETERETLNELDRIVGGADDEAVESFKFAVKEAGQSTKEKQGMWTNSTSRDLVQYNDGFSASIWFCARSCTSTRRRASSESA